MYNFSVSVVTSAGEFLTPFGLAEAANRRVSMYSGGMCRRLDIAISLIGNPQVVFLWT